MILGLVSSCYTAGMSAIEPESKRNRSFYCMSLDRIELFPLFAGSNALIPGV